ncbi:MAG: NAD(P)/FAD-dependent oxidoreductase [Deltaproteobacteria bacterium]|nr:NAD(P)/FAD-dependent oxidoreductase [Deltaproteobacteria bacterium]
MHYKLYKKERLNPPYDAIVIGSGIGGLSTAALLAKAGKKVIVLERHYVAGGFTHTFQRKGYEWDVGLHYVGEVHRPHSILRKIFDYITDQQLQWAEMASTYDRIIFGKESYNFVSGKKNLIKKLVEYFPEEKMAIEQYFQAVESCAKSAKNFFMEKSLPSFISKIASPFLSKSFLEYSNQTTQEVLSKLTQNQKLIGLLTAQYGDYGLIPDESSFAIHAMVNKHYFEGGAYPVGGSGKIAETILPVIEGSGGTILVKAEVKELLWKNKTVTGVRLQNGDEIQAPMVISSTGVLHTYQKLIPENLQKEAGLKDKLKQVRPSLAHLCIYIGLKESAENLGFEKTNLWIYPDYDHNTNMRNYQKDPASPLPLVYISFPSAKDPSWNERFPGRATIEVIGMAPYEWFEKWKDQPWNKRGEDYENYKKQLSERLLEVVFQHLPQIKDKIDHIELSTPLSTQHFCNYSRGEIYGIDHTPQRFQQKWLRPQSPFKGLYLTGQDIVTDGIGGALMAGVLTASTVLKKNIIKVILS